MEIAKQTAVMAVIACLAMPLHAQDQEQVSGQREERPGQPSISITKESSLPLEELAGKRVFVSFKNSGKLTEALADRVARLGGQVALSADDADVVLEGQGLFLAAREFGGRRALADAGEVFENAGHVRIRNASFEILLTTGTPVLSAIESMAVLNLVNTVGKVTGVKGWLNNLIAGDPDGFCYRGCEYKQMAAIVLKMSNREGQRIGTAAVSADAQDRRLMPLPLVEAAWGSLLAELGGS